MNVRAAGPALLISALLLGCSGGPAAAPSSPVEPPVTPGVVLTTLQMNIDPSVPTGQEVYQCFLFDAGAAKGASVHALRWTPPSSTLLIHHAMLFASSATGSPGPVPCDPMPPAVAVLPLYAPGGEDTALPEGVSIVIPSSAMSIFVQLHLVRTAVGAATASVDFLASETVPAHLAGWVDDFAPVPSLAPHSVATSTAQCRFLGPVHIVGSWPHMHRLGAHFEGTVLRADGESEQLLDVATWDFEHQPLYAVDAALGVGDSVETACSWNNTTDATVNAGPFSSDEMCNQGLVVWPQESAYCVR